MPTTLTETSTFTTDVTVPNDGDTRNAASVRSAFQALADRTKFLKDIIGAGGTGATRLRTVTTSAALRALTDMDEGDLALLKPGDPSSQAIFVYSSGASNAEISGWIYEPDVGGGRWLNLLWPRISGSTADALRWATPVPNRVLHFDTTAWGATTTTVTPSGSWDDTEIVSNEYAVETGDKFQVTYTGSIRGIAISNFVSARLATVVSGTATAITGSEATFIDDAVDVTNKHALSLVAGGTFGADADVSFMLQVRSGAGDTITVYGPQNIAVQVIRPLRAAIVDALIVRAGHGAGWNRRIAARRARTSNCLRARGEAFAPRRAHRDIAFAVALLPIAHLPWRARRARIIRPASARLSPAPSRSRRPARARPPRRPVRRAGLPALARTGPDARLCRPGRAHGRHGPASARGNDPARSAPRLPRSASRPARPSAHRLTG